MSAFIDIYTAGHGITVFRILISGFAVAEIWSIDVLAVCVAATGVDALFTFVDVLTFAAIFIVIIAILTWTVIWTFTIKTHGVFFAIVYSQHTFIDICAFHACTRIPYLTLTAKGPLCVWTRSMVMTRVCWYLTLINIVTVTAISAISFLTATLKRTSDVCADRI